MIQNLAKEATIAINEIYKKLYFICLSIFMVEENIFAKLTRNESEENKDYFKDLIALYLELVNNKNEETTV